MTFFIRLCQPNKTSVSVRVCPWLNNKMNIKFKKVLVTGGAKGIGRGRIPWDAWGSLMTWQMWSCFWPATRPGS